MALRPVHVNIKARDVPAVSRFWAAALGWRVYVRRSGVIAYVGPGGGFVWPDPVAVGVDVVPVPEPRSARRNPMRLDLATTSAGHRAELVARLRELGATPAGAGRDDVAALADPEGNEFRVVPPREDHHDTGPIAAVVVDCADPREMARFWGAALDWTVHEVTDDRAVLRSATGVGPFLEFPRTPDGRTEMGHVHLDLLPCPGDDRAAEVARVRNLGAADLDLGQGDVPWTCLTDPEGHEFCVLGG